MTKPDEERFLKLVQRVNDLEVLLENLSVQYNNHDHPYKPPPVYGRGSL